MPMLVARVCSGAASIRCIRGSVAGRTVMPWRCGLLIVLLALLLPAVRGSSSFSSLPKLIVGRASAKPLPSNIRAQLKAAAEAEEVLVKTTRSREAEVATDILNKRPLRTLNLPAGSTAWCPLLGVNATGSQRPSLMAMVEAVNSQYRMKDMTWEAAMSDDLAAVAVAGVWWSAKQRPVPVTLITQSSVDRVPQLYSQCKSWRGPLSAVMYLGVYQPKADALTEDNLLLLKKAAAHVSNLFADLENDDSACKLDIMLVYEVYTEAQAMMLYPINVLRNLARVQARTHLLALVDVDMLMGSRFYRDLRNDLAFSQRLVEAARARTAFVLPAFETYGSVYEAAAIADLLASRDKLFLMDGIKKGIIGPFDHKRFPQGHNWTLFNRWYRTEQPYQVTYGPRYEPWTIVDRMLAPWHDVRFRGYGQNKIVHIAHMNATSFKFVVLGNAFIVHRSHKSTTARESLVAGKTVYDAAVATQQPVDVTSIYGHTKALFDDARHRMVVGQFQPVLDPATLYCRSTLSWWVQA